MADKLPIVLTNGQKEVLQSSDKLSITALATGTPDGTKFIRDDGVLATPSGGSSSNSLKVYMSQTFN